jgi:hypothetical protein
MTATPPEAKVEYSRAPKARQSAVGGSPRPSTLVSTSVLGATFLGALALVIAELTTLYEVRSGARGAIVKSVGTGSNHGYAMALIAVCALVLALGVSRTSSRPGLLAIGVLGIVALLIALLGDLPDAQASGLLPLGGGYTTASSSPTTGLYLETLGAILLLIACGLGILLSAPPKRTRRR